MYFPQSHSKEMAELKFDPSGLAPALMSLLEDLSDLEEAFPRCFFQEVHVNVQFSPLRSNSNKVKIFFKCFFHRFNESFILKKFQSLTFFSPERPGGKSDLQKYKL